MTEGQHLKLKRCALAKESQESRCQRHQRRRTRESKENGSPKFIHNFRVCESHSPQEVVADEGYHSNAVLRKLGEKWVRSYIPEPERGRRKWVGKAAEQKAVYGNRRRVRGAHGKRLMRWRREYIERSFAHLYETGVMRGRTYEGEITSGSGF